MKLTKPLDAILNTEAKIRILRFFCRTGAEWNGSQIAKEIGITPAAAHAALNALFKEGVLQLRKIGKTHAYSLRQDSFLATDLLKPLFAKEDKILDTIIEMIKRKVLSFKARKEIISVALFGSVGMRRESSASDIDIAVIVSHRRMKSPIENLFAKIDGRVAREFGNTISLYINTQAGFKAKHKQGLALINSILKSYKLIYGQRLESLL